MFVNRSLELNVWGAYDAIASISDEVTHSFVKAFPSLESRVIAIENILPESYVRARADEFNVSEEMTGKVRLLSIGRFCAAKNYDNVPYIARYMVKLGIQDLKWYIIGFGGDEALIRTKIKRNRNGRPCCSARKERKSLSLYKGL